MTSKAKHDMVLNWHAKGYDIDIIAKYLNLTEQEIYDIITQKPAPTIKTTPEFTEPPLFE